jgi:hypothetical protein
MSSRRHFLRLTLGLTALTPLRLPAQATAEPRPRGVEALGLFLDTLLPADDTPSATALGVDSLLLEQARGDAELEHLIALGCERLDEAARRRGKPGFARLDARAREDVVAEAEKAPIGSVPSAFFHILRHHAFGHYYADARTWIALGYAGPPQPRGFPDFAQPPPTPVE